MALIDDYRIAVDVLIIDPALPGASRLVELLRHSHGSMLVIAVTADSESLRPGLPPVDAVRRRPHLFDDEGQGDWVRLVQNLLRSHTTGPA